MAKKGMINRELKREATVAKYAAKRAELKSCYCKRKCIRRRTFRSDDEITSITT